MSQSSGSPTAPTLVVTGGPFDGQALTLAEGAAAQVLGSGPDAQLRLELGNIDAVHARVVWGKRGVLLSDAGSSTGTYVNGEKIGSDRALQNGDRVFLGPPGSKQSAKLLAVVPEGVVVAFMACSLRWCSPAAGSWSVVCPGAGRHAGV